MDIDEVPDLGLVPDDFAPGAHEKLDHQICQSLPVINDISAPLVLSQIVRQSDHRLLPKYSDSINECKTVLKDHPRLYSMLETGSKSSYKNVRLLKILRPTPILEHGERVATAAERGWEDDYVGDAAQALRNHVQMWFSKDDSSGDSSQRRYYAKYSTIVQSSGMGKSRVVDELGKLQFVLPVNLRGPESSGYPPPDLPAYDYLKNSSSQQDAFVRSCSFLEALFLQTARVLDGITERPAAKQFRDYMREGMDHRAHGEPRRNFYEAVRTEAEACRTRYWLHFRMPTSPSDDIVDELLCQDEFPLRSAFHKLHDALEGRSVDNERQPKRQKKDSGPRVVLSFDEVHTLSGREGENSNPWSRFGEIRRAIRGLQKESLFTLFLSTSGSLFSVTPTPKGDWSAKMVRSGDVMLPFYELGFDQLAVRVNFSQTVSLSQVTSEESFSSYGRPLWRPYYQSGDKSGIIEFAALKLLGGTRYAGQPLSTNQKLACLAQRIPIEFLSAQYASQISEPEKEQVNSHMRVILKVEGSLETLVTMSPSEPILSEAAYFLMSQAKFLAPQVLKTILDGFAVHKGELGELIVALLFILARDQAIGDADVDGSPISKQRWCSITGLLGSLFCPPRSPAEVNVVESFGWRLTLEGTSVLRSSLAGTFQDSKVYFTHFIKVHQHTLVEVEFLMRLMVRGAAILCGNCQPGVDGIIPFLLKGDEITRDNIGVIMFQVKNDARYTDIPKVDPFQKMDPHSSGIGISTDIPIIRLFFALASHSPTLKLVQYEAGDGARKKSYDTYDFWVAGLSPSFLVPVAGDQDAWNDILQASQRWQRIYSGGDPVSRRLRQNMNPGAGDAKQFWENWCDEFPQ